MFFYTTKLCLNCKFDMRQHDGNKCRVGSTELEVASVYHGKEANNQYGGSLILWDCGACGFRNPRYEYKELDPCVSCKVINRVPQ